MPYISRKTRRNILLFLAALLCAFLVSLIVQHPTYHIAASMYIALIFIWIQTAQWRILSKTIRRYLVLGAALLMLLMCLREFRYEFVDRSPLAAKYLWYSYYIPFTAVPLCSLCAALCVGAEEGAKPLRHAKWLWAACAFLVAAILTNELHGMMFLIEGSGSDYFYEYGFLYYLTVLWCAGLTIAAFAILLHRCRLSQCRQYWYIPLTAALPGTALLIWYFIVGGSPTIGGVKLYRLQEAFAVLFIGLWESCIQIGLIPSNSDYDELFRLSHLSAMLLDQGGTVRYRAEAFSPADGNTHVQRERPIHGGKILWTADRSAICELNDELQDATEVLEEENELIEQENRIQAEKARYMEQNRLYDKITDTVRPQLAAIAQFLDTPPQGKAAFRQAMAHSMVLGAYVKRRANLELLADRQSHISLEELTYAIRESFEYLTLSGCTCELQAETSAEVPAPLLPLAYDLFELVVETAYPVCGSYSAIITSPFSLALAVDSDHLTLDPDWRQAALAEARAALSVFSEDDTTYVRLVGEEARP